MGRPAPPSPPAGTVSAGQSPGRRHLESSVRVWVGEEAGQVVWAQEQDKRVCISNQDTEPAPEGSRESWKPVSMAGSNSYVERKFLAAFWALD